MSTPEKSKHASWAYAEEHRAPDELVEQARELSADVGTHPISDGTAAALSAFAAACGARSIVGIGLGAGLAGAALMRGAAADAVLTGIDADADCVSATRQLLGSLRVAPSRTRLITGKAAEVLPRLTPKGYDLVFIDAAGESAVEYVTQGLRLLHAGGTLILNDALDADRVPKPAVREASTQAMRRVEATLREDDAVVTAMFSTGTGLLVAVKR
jgi:predicted O-methyltransferase YrrM